MRGRTEAAYKLSKGGRQEGATPEGSFRTAGPPPNGPPTYTLNTKIPAEIEDRLTRTKSTRAGTRTTISTKSRSGETP
jgi:hypothetical protein